MEANDHSRRGGADTLAPVTIETGPDLEQRIKAALERVRPFLKVDGGDVELVRIDEEAHIVEVRFLGACQTCSLAPMTLRAGVERAILHSAPEVARVENLPGNTK